MAVRDRANHEPLLNERSQHRLDIVVHLEVVIGGPLLVEIPRRIGDARPAPAHLLDHRGVIANEELVIVNGNANPAPDDAALNTVLELAVADAQAALELVRRRADEWHVDPRRVGIIGFSAGGGVAVGTALAAKPDASPAFLVSVYGPSLQDVNVPANAPPLFVAVGATHFNVTNGCLALFAAWKAAGKPAEIHVYDGISAGFGMTKRGHPVDGWADRLHEWLVARELTRQN